MQNFSQYHQGSRIHTQKTGMLVDIAMTEAIIKNFFISVTFVVFLVNCTDGSY